MGSARTAEGQVTFVGSVEPESPPNGNLNDDLEIGDESSSNDDPRAIVDIAPSTEFTADRVYVGSDENFFGQLLVRGAGGLFFDSTLLTIDSGGSTAEPAFQVGRSGEGYAVVSGGARIDVSSTSGDISIGDNATGVGFLRVTGTNSLVTIGDDLFVGNAGVARLEILDGGLMQFTDAGLSGLGNKDTIIGVAEGSVGEVYVDGSRSRFRTGEDLTVGGSGHGLLSITGGAVVQADNDESSSVLVGPKGRISFDGGTLQVGTMTINGVLGGAGVINGDGDGGGQTSVGLGGRVEVAAGQLLRFDDNVSNQGMVNIEGGEIEFLDGFTNNAIGALSAPGRITLESGRVRFVEAMDNFGVIAVTQGASDIHGQVDNETGGSVVVAPDSVATFHDDFDENGGVLDIQSGGSALFLANANFLPTSTVSLSLATDEPTLSVAGDLLVDGDLEVALDADFTPTAGTFELITAGSLSGTFDNVTLPSVAGFDLSTQYTSTGVLLSLATATVGGPDNGDFNNDGRVDLADYTAWRDVAGTPPDLTGYGVWVANFGSVFSSSQTQSQPVPEPMSAVLVVAMLAGTVYAGRRSDG
ncbi:MAG: hypothetical protein AAFV43_04600 [Planctomycetota bacterium]